MRKLLFNLLSPWVVMLAAHTGTYDADLDNSKSTVTDIVVVFKMHVDIGYTNWAEGVLQKYSGEMLEETLKSIEATSGLPKEEQFVWTIPGWPLKYMLENCPADKRMKLEQAIQEERIVPHALPFTFETEASDLENLVRGLSFSADINDTYGLSHARDAKLTDVPSHARILPTLLTNAGIDFLHLGCNPGSASPEVPTLFWWEGPDGSRLLTFYWSEYYGSGVLPPDGWPYKTWLAMIHTHENTGAPAPEEVAELLKQARDEMPGVRIRIGRLSDFYDLLMKEDPDLPVVTGDMPDTWIHGYLSNPHETKLSKHLQRETYHTEILHAHLRLWGADREGIGSYIEEAVENMILYDEHTFGAAMSHGNQHKWTYGDEFRIHRSLGHYDYLEGTWKEKGNRIRHAEKIIVPLMNRQLKQLASAVSLEGQRIIVYNPLPWKRSGRVTFFGGVYQKGFSIHGLRDAVTGRLMPVYEDYNLISFDADSVPSMGYRTYIPILEQVDRANTLAIDEENHILENRFFQLQLDGTLGTVASLIDRRSNRELVRQEGGYGFGQYFLEQPGQQQVERYNRDYIKPGAEHWAEDEMIRPAVPVPETRIYRGRCTKILYLDMGNAVRATVFGKLDNPDPQSYMVTYTLYENQPYVELVWAVEGKNPEPLPEAGWLSFTFHLDQPEYRLYRTGGMVDPQTELVKGSNQDFYFLNTSMTIFDDQGNGVSLNCPSSPGISIDNPGLFRYSGEKHLHTGSVFVNLFNNQWGTNFTEWIEGSFSSRICIWSYEDFDAEKSLITPSEETRVPLKGVFHDGPAGKLPLSSEGISLSRKGILVTAFHPLPEEDGLLLRLWEQAGRSGSCEITLPEGSLITEACPVNLRNAGTDGKAIEVSDHAFRVMIRAYQPLSVILK
jgi:hypothetical protein